MIKYANNPVTKNRLKGKSMATKKRKPAKRKHSRRANGAATATRATNPPRKHKRTTAKHHARRASTSRHHNRAKTTHKRKSTRRRYNGARIGNPISAGGAMKFAIAAGTAGAINAVINTIMSMLNLQIPQQGILGLGAKLAVAYGVGALLPKTKVISQDTANIVAITIAAAAFTSWLTPMLDGLLGSFMPAATSPGAQDIYGIPPGAFPNGYGPYPTAQQISARPPVTPAAVQVRNKSMNDIYGVQRGSFPNGVGPYQQASFAPGV